MYCVGVSDVMPMWMAGQMHMAVRAQSMAKILRGICLLSRKNTTKTKQYKYQGQRVVDTRYADLKGQRRPQHIGCEHDV